MVGLRIGIDVGGTNTDCVLLDPDLQESSSRGIITCAKTLTTPDITTGIFTVIQKVIDQSKVDVQRIAIVTVGTTHFLNAIIERDVSRLDKVAIIRLSSNFTRSIPPFSDFPEELKKVLYGYNGYVSGGLQIDGSLIGEIKEEEIIEQCQIIKEKGLKVIVVAGVYSPIDTFYQQEYNVKKIILKHLPDVRVVCSRDVGTVGFLERENSAILNGSILRFSEYVIQSFKNALIRLNLNSPLFLTQNDGTMISSETVKETPIVTFSSGPTNSILGAAYLSQVNNKNHSNVIVADIGGTTTDIGILLPSGFPKQASAYLSIAGVKINYSMPHIHSIGLGGGSIIRQTDDKISIGPDSVGFNLNSQSIIFGGNTLTTTDISYLADDSIVLDHADRLLISSLKPNTELISSKFHDILSTAIDSIKTSQDDIPLILVGGGSIIIGNDLKGVSKVIKPKYYQHANAVGAAVAKISHTIDIIVERSDDFDIEIIKRRAIDELINEKHALEKSCYIVDVISIPVQYSGNQVRVIVKAAGDINLDCYSNELTSNIDLVNGFDKYSIKNGKKLDKIKENDIRFSVLDYYPSIKEGIWDISQTDLHWISNGCYVLGCAGGGSPQCEYLEIKNLLNDGFKIKIKKWESINENEIVGWGGIMGSPTVSYERLGGTDTIDALSEILRYTGKDCNAIMGLEIGGANGLQALLLSSSKYFDKPLLDCDWMGRAYPTYYQTTLATHTDGKLTPAAIADGVGNAMVLSKASRFVNSDILLRSACSELGSRVGYSGRPTEAEFVKKFAVKNSYSLAWRIGRQISYCQENNCTDEVADRIINEVGGIKSAKKLFSGKIISIEQKLYKAHTFGEIIIQSFSEDEKESSRSNIAFESNGGILRVPFKNEIIYAEHDDGIEKKVLASVPDLISVIDLQSGQAVGVPEFKYGLRVVVIGIACSELWNDTEKSMKYGGLEAFDLSTTLEHKSIGLYKETKSVIEEYNS